MSHPIQRQRQITPEVPRLTVVPELLTVEIDILEHREAHPVAYDATASLINRSPAFGDVIRQHRGHSVTVLDGDTPLLHAGFRDEELDVELLFFYLHEPTPEEVHTEPHLSYIVGNTAALNPDNAIDSVMALFKAVGRRQKYHQQSLVQRYASGRRSLDAITQDTVPREGFVAALGHLTQLAQPREPVN